MTAGRTGSPARALFAALLEQLHVEVDHLVVQPLAIREAAQLVPRELHVELVRDLGKVGRLRKFQRVPRTVY